MGREAGCALPQYVNQPHRLCLVPFANDNDAQTGRRDTVSAADRRRDTVREVVYKTARDAIAIVARPAYFAVEPSDVDRLSARKDEILGRNETLNLFARHM